MNSLFNLKYYINYQYINKIIQFISKLIVSSNTWGDIKCREFVKQRWFFFFLDILKVCFSLQFKRGSNNTAIDPKRKQSPFRKW